MKNIVFILLSIFVICISKNIQAQGEAAVPFLLLDASPQLTGMAGAVVALPTEDVYGARYNPAQLGNFSRSKNVGIGFYPVKTEWLPSLNFSDLTLNSTAIALGHTFNSKIPIHVGLGFIYTKFNLDKNVYTDASGNELGAFDSFESSTAITLGAGMDYYAQFNVGLTYKYINSELIPSYIYVGSEQRGANATASAFDFGLLVNVPVFDLVFSDENFPSFGMVSPFFNISAGYALLNLGNEISYINEYEADPLPRLGKLGYGISIGLNNEFKGTDINIFQLDFSIESQDLLFTRSAQKGIEYKNILGDINIIDNIILGKSNDDIDVTRGGRIKIFNTLQYSFGTKLGRGYYSFNTSGFSLSTKGILMWLALSSQNADLKYIAKHFSLEYAWSKYDIDSSWADDTEFHGLQLKMFGFW